MAESRLKLRGRPKRRDAKRRSVYFDETLWRKVRIYACFRRTSISNVLEKSVTKYIQNSQLLEPDVLKNCDLVCDGCHKKIIVANGDVIYEKSIIAELDGKKSNGRFDFTFCLKCDTDFEQIMKTIKAKGMPIHVDFLPNRFQETVSRVLCHHCRYDNLPGDLICQKCGYQVTI